MRIDPAKFEQFEAENGLFSIRVNEVAVWERIRFDVFREIQRQNGMGEAHTGLNYDIEDYLRGGLLWLRNLFVRNPFLAGEHDVLFVGHQRRKLQSDGYWWDIYCDPIHEATELDYVHLEYPHYLSHYQPAKTENLRYLELIDYGGMIQRLLGLQTPTLPDETVIKLEAAEDELLQRFDADVDLVSRTEAVVHIRETTLWLYDLLLNRIDPRVVVDVVSYNDETLIESCKRRGVPVVELQHGVITDHHFGYSYPADHPKQAFPDYLLTFGSFWKENARIPLPDDRVIPVGYPYLEQRLSDYDNVKSKKQIVFVSQGPVGSQLSEFAVRVHRDPRLSHEIVYKLHPGEYDRWTEEYPHLVESDLRVVDSPDPPLYSIFAESSVQIGIGSTAVYEGLCFDLETYVCDYPGAEVVLPLIESGAASLIDSVDELVDYLWSDPTGKGGFDKERFFMRDSLSRIERELNRIATEGTSYYHS